MATKAELDAVEKCFTDGQYCGDCAHCIRYTDDGEVQRECEVLDKSLDFTECPGGSAFLEDSDDEEEE